MRSAQVQQRPDPALERFRAAVDMIFGPRIERVVLFGSRARGDARADSDYDIAIFLKDFTDRRREVLRLVPVVTDIIEDSGVVIHPMPFRAGAWRDRTPLMHEIRRDGIDL
jgi:predicted nucleotidyltransferase